MEFVGMLNFYCDMWCRQSHLISPLTPLMTKKSKFKWGPKQVQAPWLGKRCFGDVVMFSDLDPMAGITSLATDL